MESCASLGFRLLLGNSSRWISVFTILSLNQTTEIQKRQECFDSKNLKVTGQVWVDALVWGDVRQHAEECYMLNTLM